MAYTNPWDESQPPDSQLANQLGQDVRSLKTDIHERLLLSGTLAARPTPEAVFVGTIYYATDLQIFYRWSGSAWIVMGGVEKYSDTSVHNISGTTAGGSAVTFPAGSLRIGSTIRYEFGIQLTGAGACIIHPTFANVDLGTTGNISGNGTALVGDGEIILTSATAIQTLWKAIQSGTGNVYIQRVGNSAAFDLIANAPILYMNCSAPGGTTVISNYLSAWVAH